jgi:hypothetical protein
VGRRAVGGHRPIRRDRHEDVDQKKHQHLPTDLCGTEKNGELERGKGNDRSDQAGNVPYQIRHLLSSCRR